MPDTTDNSDLTRRQLLATAGGAGLLAAVGAGVASAPAAHAATPASDGTPEQVHLTWGQDPATSVTVSWASPDRSVNPGVRLGHGLIPAQERSYTDGLNGETVWTYHVRLGGLRPDTSYSYEVTAANATEPFSAAWKGRWRRPAAARRSTGSWSRCT
jgi:phosphodiesterase/alkaline phosphatase D-like protein